jgi:hypothetical protein
MHGVFLQQNKKHSDVLVVGEGHLKSLYFSLEFFAIRFQFHHLKQIEIRIIGQKEGRVEG